MGIKEDIDRLEAEKKILEKDIQEKQHELELCQQEVHAAENARTILQLAARKTQENVEVRFSDLVTKAFKIVFDDPYTFVPKFEERRNHTECDLWFQKNDKLYRPRFASGGGVIDVASFALRLAYWRFEKSAPILILDEPFRQLSRNLIPRAAEMLKMLAEEFDIQMIISTHIDQLSDIADYRFEIKNGKVV